MLADNFIGVAFCLSLGTDWHEAREPGCSWGQGQAPKLPYAIHLSVFFFSLLCLPCESACVCVMCCLLGPFGTLLHLFEVIIQFALLFFRGGAAACAKLFLRLTIFKSFQAPLK